VLVLYGTREGHAAKVAGAVADGLRRAGTQAHVVDAAASHPDAVAYDAVVVVASVHKGDYGSEVHDWTRRQARALNSMPSAFVSISLGVLQKDSDVQQDIEAILARFLERTGWQPKALLHAAGALMYSRYNIVERMLMKRIAAQAGGDTDTRRDYEYTDWKALAEFTRRFAHTLKPPSP
jgi:menaquinone-dependent protoporphyrinogen oxidase